MLNKNLDIFRFENNTPEYYPDYSRDFQLICRAYNCLIANEKFDIDTLIYSIDTSKCNAKLLELLCTKLGFFTKKSFMSTQLRYILHGFVPAVRKKGTKQAIEWVVRLFLKALNLDSVVFINIIKKVEISGKIDHNNSYIVQIGIRSTRVDTTLLEEVLKYILPTGFKYQIIFYISPDTAAFTYLYYKDNVSVIFIEDIINSINRGSKDILFDNNNVPDEVEYIVKEGYLPNERYFIEAIDSGRSYLLPKQFEEVIGAVDTVQVIRSEDILTWHNLMCTGLTSNTEETLYNVVDSNNIFIRVDMVTPSTEYIVLYSRDEIDEFIRGVLEGLTLTYLVDNAGSEVIDINNQMIYTRDTTQTQSTYSTTEIEDFVESVESNGQN